MIVLQLSDLHLSRYGESKIWTEKADDDGREWTALQRWKRWQIEGCRDKKDRPDDLRLVDPEGVIHKVRGWPSRKEDKAIAALLSIAMERHQTSAERLVKRRPSPEDLEAMIRVDPDNTNLRFLRLVDRINEIGPDVLLLTGDTTDNGFGYGLVAHYLSPWIQAGRFFVVPGNHDTYDMFPRRGRAKRVERKEETYLEFAKKVGLAPEEHGAYVRLMMGDVIVVGLNSCDMPRTWLSASGAVSTEQLEWLAELAREPEFQRARHRVALLHHHLLRMPFTVGKRNPIEAGMRLRNAVKTVQALTDAGIDVVFNGHRHQGYLVKLPGRPMVVSGPSSTLGCKTYGSCYGWSIDLEDDQPLPQMVDLPGRSRTGTFK